MADVDRTVSIRQRCSHQRTRKLFLFLHDDIVVRLLISYLGCKGTKKFLLYVP
jgi:hypothetical protein